MNNITKLKKYDKEYYETGISPVSDREYDDIKEQAKSEFPDDPYFQTVGSSTSKKIKIPYILGSLTKYKPDDINKLEKKFGKKEIIASEKIDGMSVLVQWKNGKIVFACTRGDGIEGQDITEKMKIVCPRLKPTESYVMRGELIVLGNKYLEYGYKNSRNATVGIINRDNLSQLDIITPYFYEIIWPDVKASEHIKFAIIQNLGLSIPRYKLCIIKNIESVLKNWKSDYIGYEIDGVVISPIEYKRENVLYPENKVAFKVNQEAVETTVDHVEWFGSRTGKLVPTVVFDPIEISGSIVKRASGFNAEYIKTTGINKGAKIGIVKSGEIIPYIESVYESVKAEIPDKCPNCGANTEMVGVDLTCTNLKCSERVVAATAYFLKTMGVEGMSETTLWNLEVKEITDVYLLTEEDIMEKEGFGYKRATEICFQLQKSLDAKPHMFLAALGIPMISTENAKTIIDKNGIGRIWELKEDGVGLGPVASKSFVDNINTYKGLYNFLLVKGLKFKEKKETSKIQGLVFTLTGEGNLSRPEYTRLIEDNGSYVKSISKKTNYLVCSRLDSTSGKMKKAKEFGIKTIMYNDLDKMLGLN